MRWVMLLGMLLIASGAGAQPRLNARQMELTGAMVGAIQGCNGDIAWVVEMRDLARAIDSWLFRTAFEAGFATGLDRARQNSPDQCNAVLGARAEAERTLRGR